MEQRQGQQQSSKRGVISTERREGYVLPSRQSQNSSVASESGAATFYKALELVLQYLTWEQVGVCRLVSKKWYSIALPAWLAAAPAITVRPVLRPAGEVVCRRTLEYLGILKFFDPEALIDILEGRGTPPAELPSKSNKSVLFKYAGVRQYETLAFQDMDLMLDRDQIESAVLPYTMTCITRLELSNVVVHLSDLSLFRDLVLCRDLPNVKFLKVRGFPDPSGRNGERGKKIVNIPAPCEHVVVDTGEHANLREFEYRFGKRNAFDCTVEHDPMDWRVLLKRYPNLESLKIGYRFSSFSAELYSLLSAIKEFKSEKPHVLNLKTFEIGGTTNHEVVIDGHLVSPFVMFPELSLNLESFLIGFGPGTPTALIHDVLASQAGTLKELTIFVSPMFINYEFPVMEKLEHLHLMDYAVPTMSFLNRCPNLKSLSFHSVMASGLVADTIVSATDDNDMVGVTLSSLTKLDIGFEGGAGHLTAASIQTLGKWMPNVSNLVIALTNETLPAVCESWPNLAKLFVGGKMGAKAIIAVLKDDQQLNFQELRSFFWKPEIIPCLKEKSVVEGFMKMPRLEYLLIGVRDEVVNKGFLRALHQRIQKNVQVCVKILNGRCMIPVCIECTVGRPGTVIIHPVLRRHAHDHSPPPCPHVFPDPSPFHEYRQ